MKWKTLRHNGILFPPEYEPRGIRFKIKDKDVRLTPLQEEMVYQWAKKKDTPYVQDAVFRRNFTADFAATFKPKIRFSYKNLDFSDAHRLVDQEKEIKLLMTKEERKELAAKRKAVREELKAKYGTATVDGKRVDLGNYMAEPPGIFIGRGKHPLRGKWKPRIDIGDVTLNLDKKAKVPPGKWGGVAHEADSVWVAKWTDRLTGKVKYVWLADTAGLKQEMDRAKYEKASILAESISDVEDALHRDMAGEKSFKIATACYLIYRTAMRVGDEKDPDEADTVGATTLRKEHISIVGDRIDLDFLGKDSVRWKETIHTDERERQFRDNLARLMSDKKDGDEIFDGIKSQTVNKYLSGVVKGVTAKVFRTYLATKVVTEYLAKNDNLKDASASKKIHYAKMANLQAAIRCNHKRTIPKTFRQSLQKKKDSLKKVKTQAPWAKTEETLEKIKSAKPRTEKQKKARLARMRRTRSVIKRKKERHAERIEKLSLQIKLAEKTRDYNLGTSLRNYIDPRVFKAWTDEMGAQWEKMYTAALQKKFLWVMDEKPSWAKIKSSV